MGEKVIRRRAGKSLLTEARGSGVRNPYEGETGKPLLSEARGI
jgi:hypothetical protein